MALCLSHRRHLLRLLMFPSPPNTLQLLPHSSASLYPVSSHRSLRARPSPLAPQPHHLLPTMLLPACPPKPQAPSPHHPRRSTHQHQLRHQQVPCQASSGLQVAQIAETNPSHRQHPLPRFLKALARRPTQVALQPLPAQCKVSLSPPTYLPHPSHMRRPEHPLQCLPYLKHLLHLNCLPQHPPTLSRHHLQQAQQFPSLPTQLKLFAL
jgi:hypothetical protein